MERPRPSARLGAKSSLRCRAVVAAIHYTYACMCMHMFLEVSLLIHAFIQVLLGHVDEPYGMFRVAILV